MATVTVSDAYQGHGLAGTYSDSRHGGVLHLCQEGANTFSGFYSEIGLIFGQLEDNVFSGTWIEAGVEDNEGDFIFEIPQSFLSTFGFLSESLSGSFDDFDDAPLRGSYSMGGTDYDWTIERIGLVDTTTPENCFHFEEEEDGTLRGQFLNLELLFEDEEHDGSGSEEAGEYRISATWDLCDVFHDIEDEEDSPDASASGGHSGIDYDAWGSAEFSRKQRSFYFEGYYLDGDRTFVGNLWRGDAGSEVITEMIILARLLTNETFTAYIWVGGQDPVERQHLNIHEDAHYVIEMERDFREDTEDDDLEPEDCDRHEKLATGDFEFESIGASAASTTLALSWALFLGLLVALLL